MVLYFFVDVLNVLCLMVILYSILSSENVFQLSPDMNTKAQAIYQAIICSIGFVFWGMIALLNVFICLHLKL